MLKKVVDYVEKYHMLKPGDEVTVGVSGGADSVCLLFLLSELREDYEFSLKAVHVHHGIRSDAGEDETYVKELCDRLMVPLTIYHEDVPRYASEHGLSTEEAGRILRYKDFAITAGTTGKIAVAHNSNDRGETMLFHLFRGTGLKGACSIRPVNGNIIRPILCMSRFEIETYLEEKGIVYQTDSTNLENDYSRNKIRNIMIPYAEKEICSGAGRHLQEAADRFLEAQEFIELKTKEAAESCYDEKLKAVELEVFSHLDNYLQEQVILMLLEKNSNGRKDITSVHIGNIFDLLQKDGNVSIDLPYGLKIRKEYGKLFFLQNKKDKMAQEELLIFDEKKEIPALCINVPGLGIVDISTFSYEKNMAFPRKTYTKWFDYDKISSNISFRTRKTGDFLLINPNMDRKSLKEYMINEKISASERNELYLLADESHIIWIPGYRISEYYKVNDKTKKIIQMKVRDQEL